jgi:uncharacterized protein (DUF362 family)
MGGICGNHPFHVAKEYIIMRYSRRDFLKLSASSGIAAAASTTLFGAPAASPSEVYVGKGATVETITKVLKKMGGIERFVKPGSRVLIKPNMSFANPPEWATNTSPEAVYIVAKLCLDAGAKRVIICDNTIHDPELCKQKTGIPAAVKNLKGAVIYIPKQDASFIEKSDSRAEELTKVAVVKEVYQSDCFISLCGAKSHAAGFVSFNTKGLMGLVKDRDVYHRDMDLHTAIAEQLYYMKPNLSIVDASRALLDNGPAGPGKVVELKTFVAGTDIVAVDSFGVSLASWYGRKCEGKQVQHLKIANKLGLGNVESSMIKEIAV